MERPSGRIGVDAFDPAYGAAYEAGGSPELDVECELAEDGGAFVAHRPRRADAPERIAFVDGVMRTEARLTLTAPDGTVRTGVAGSWASGAVLVTPDPPATFARVAVGRVTVFTGGATVSLPDRGAWSWEAHATPGGDFADARQAHQRLMRDAEAETAESLAGDGWLTVLDGPLHNIRQHRTVPVLGYVKTHRRRTLAPEHWARVPELAVGERSGLFALGDDYACYLRIGDPGLWAAPWSGIARIEVGAAVGLEAAVAIADRASGWLPGFGSALHRDARAPVNLTPIAGLERHLHHLQGDARLALRAVREAAMRRNSP